MSAFAEAVTSIAELDRLRNDWESLLGVHPSPSPFDTLEWIDANLVSFPDQQIRILVIRNNANENIGILPLALRRRRKYLRQRNWLEFAGLPFGDYGSYLVRPECESQVAEALMEYLLSCRSTWDGVFFDGLRKNDEFTNCLSDSARKTGMLLVMQPTHRVRRLARTSFSSREYSALQASRSLTKARRKLSQLGEIHLEVKTEKSVILAFLSEYFRMHLERCRSKGARCPLGTPQQQAFFRNIVLKCAPAGNVWLSSLYCGFSCIASRFSLRCGPTLHLYSTCFTPDFAKYSPSMLQLEALLEHAFENGIEEADFGIGDSPQKEKAGAILETELVRLELYHSADAYLERKIYSAAQLRASKSNMLGRGARVARKLFPYQV